MKQLIALTLLFAAQSASAAYYLFPSASDPASTDKMRAISSRVTGDIQITGTSTECDDYWSGFSALMTRATGNGFARVNVAYVNDLYGSEPGQLYYPLTPVTNFGVQRTCTINGVTFKMFEADAKKWSKK